MRSCLPLLGLLTALTALPATAGASTPGLNLRQPLAAVSPRHAPGQPSAAPTAGALAASVKQATGLTASQVVARSVCPAPAPGHATCAAQALVRRTTRALIHPTVRHSATFTQVFPRHRSAAPAAAPETSSSTGAPGAGTPAYLQQAYDLTYLSQTAGAGDTIAVVDAGDDPNAASDLAIYRSNYGLPACTTANGCFTKVNQSGATSPLPVSAAAAWEEEESLDLDAISALCPNCHIILVETNSSSNTDLDAGIAAAESLGANQISNSWSGTSASPIGVSTFPGATVIAATGDHGYPGAGTDDYPAAYPGVTAAGGTTLSGASDGTSLRGYSESAWSLNSSGNGWGGASGCALDEAKPPYQSDTGCSGRSYSDVSADGNPDTGLRVYDSGDGGWFVEGGTSLATPLVAAFEALTGVNGTSAQWAYTDSALLNDPATGSSGACAAAIAYICTGGIGYDGPTGIGSISGAIVSGAPGIGGPAVGDGSDNSYTQGIGPTTVSLRGGLYPNGADTAYYWQYGTTTAYGQQTATVDAGSGTAPAAASASLSGLTPGATYHYRLVAQNSYGTSYGYDYTLSTTPATNTPPVNTVAPAISGSALQGQTVTATPGTWTPSGATYAYQWQRSADGGGTWTNLAGATGSTYAIAAGDLGDELHVLVTATDAYGATVATSAATAAVGSGAPAPVNAPVLSGSAQQGQILSAVSTWSPTGTSYTYQWQESGDGSTWADVPGATSATYNLTAADLGDYLRVTITAVNAYGTMTSTTAADGPVQNLAPISTTAPAVSGTDQRTRTLTAGAGGWSGIGLSYTYQWQHSADGSTWTSIPNAISATYILQVADEGDSVRVLVTATNSSGAASAPSAGTPVISPYPPGNTAAPVITGTAQRGATLSATQGTWTGPDNTYAYQWQRDDGEGYQDIPFATSSTYALGVADEGATVRVVISAANPDATISQASAATPVVASAAPVDNSLPTVTGAAQRGTTLTSGVGAWSGVANVYAYQWQRSTDGSTWTSIAGATGATYTLALVDEGDELRLQVTATNSDGSAVASSVPTGLVTGAFPVDTTAPAIAGTAQRGTGLTGSRGTWSGVGNAYALQWQRSPDGSTWTSVNGATTSTYTPATADEGYELRLQVTVANPDGTVTVASPATAPVAATPPTAGAVPVVTGTAQRSDNLYATVGTWNGVGNAYTCRWQLSTDGGATWTDIAGATGFNYTVAVADEGARLRALISATNPDGSASAASAATAAAIGAPPVNTVAPTQSGTAARGATLSSTQGTWTGIGNTYAYQWQRSADGGSTWSNIPGATTFSYTLAVADEGAQVRVLVTATNPDAAAGAASSPTTAVVASPPVMRVAPSIVGLAQRGLTLTGGAGTWDGNNVALSYQWQRSADGSTWTSIAGATTTTYVPAVADEGDELRLLVTAANADATVADPSPPTAAVAATPPVSTTAPVVSGSPQRGQTLTSTTGGWQGVGNSYAYQWQHSSDGGTTWTNIAGATGAAYALGVADERTELRLSVTATNADGTAGATSTPTAAVPVAAPVNTTAPAITGTARRGFLLTATTGTWTGIGNVLAYQWQRSSDGITWSNITGATAGTYALTLTDEGALVRVLISASNPDGAASAPTAPTATVGGSPPANSAAPTIAGIPQRGDTLTATGGVWSGSDDQLSYQWQRSADGGSTWSAITGATRQTYTLWTPDEGAIVRVVVTALNADGTASAASTATGAVATSPPVETAAPVVTGAARRTVTLTATTGSWGGAGNTLAYQWQRSPDGTTWTTIAGATATAYTLAAADEGDAVRLLVTATNPDGSVSAASVPTATVQSAPPASTRAPAVQGTPRLGAALSVDTGAWTPMDVTFTYQWQRGDAVNGYQDIAGATGSTYTAVQADVGEGVRVQVTATDVDGNATATTAAVAAPPVNLVAPAAPSGTLVQGSTLTPDPGAWSAPATYTFTWMRCPAGATAVTAGCNTIASRATYALSVADVGYEIAVIVTATTSGGSTASAGALTGTIAGAPLYATALPSITGDPQIPDTLYANPGTWSTTLNTVSYVWERCNADGVTGCTPVVANTSAYPLSAADAGHAIVLIADVASPGRTASAQSPALAVQSQPLPQAAVLPSVGGTPTRSYTLTAQGGQWTNRPTTLSYQWERCDASGHGCQPIAGATQTTYELASADEGGTVTVAVTAGNFAGTSTATAPPTAVVSPLLPSATQAPSLSATAVQQGVPVSVAGAAWRTTSDTGYATAWERCDAGGSSCQTITGATAAAYTPVAADVGHTLVAVITATNVDGSVGSSTAASAVVLPAAPRWRDLPDLSATSGTVGSTVTVSAGAWTGPAVSTDTTQLMRCTSACTPVAGTGSYTIASADVGAILRVRETASNAGGTTVVWSAQYVGPVASAGSASAVLAQGQVVLRNNAGKALALARMTGAAAMTADVARAGASGRGHAAAGRHVSVRRAARITGRLRAWVCPAVTVRGAAPAPCTRQVSLTRSATITLPASMTGRVRIVVVRGRR